METYKEIENFLNTFDDWEVPVKSDDGRVNSLLAESGITHLINERLSLVNKKIKNRESYDLNIIQGEDLKCVNPNNFTNTISFIKLSRMLNLKGSNVEQVCKSFIDKKIKNEIKLVKDYVIFFFNKKTKKFKVCSLTELPINCITVNPSNCIQTKIPESLMERSESEKFDLVLKLFIEYINKRILNPAKDWERAING